MTQREQYSSFKFYQALKPQDLDATETTGDDIDTQGYNSLTFAINIGAFTGGGSMSDATHIVRMQHAEVSTAGGAGTYTDVDSKYIVNSGTTTITSGGFLTITSATFSGTVEAAAYVGPKRYARLLFSGAGSPSVMSVAATAELGYASDWPVNAVN